LNNKEQLEPTLATLGGFPKGIGITEHIVVDKGCYSEENVNETTRRKVTPYLAVGQ
jgi:hypothetical protein